MHLEADGGELIVRVRNRQLQPRDENQLAFWGFRPDGDGRSLRARPRDLGELAAKVTTYFSGRGVSFSVDAIIGEMLSERLKAEQTLAKALAAGEAIKEGSARLELHSKFLQHLSERLARGLKAHQLKAALHLLSVRNAANFSVPGSGKTSVVLAAFDFWRQRGEVDALFVVGPPSCFEPWQSEFKSVLGSAPTSEVLAGGDIDNRRQKYLVTPPSVSDLYLTTFQTLARDREDVQVLFRLQNIRFLLVVDEAHYIKQTGGVWASAVLSIAPHAALRIILTGTPFPHSYRDSYNLFDVLFPSAPPISPGRRQRIEEASSQGNHEEAVGLLDEAVGSLFYRVRKKELGLAPAVFHEPIRVQMKPHEREIYEAILDRVEEVAQRDYLKDFEVRSRLRRGRMMRIRQCVSYAALLDSAISEEDEAGLVPGFLAHTIRHYDQLEVPAKLDVLLELVADLHQEGEKVVIWANFVRTLNLIVARCEERGFGARMIYGGTPTESVGLDEERTREGIIRAFVSRASGIDVLVANPAACAESISLHKTCRHAIYYDLSYSCAQYLQSLDRIHRVGGSEEKSPHYYVLQYTDSVDSDILENVRSKARLMSEVIDRDYPIYDLDMFQMDEELEAYERLFASS